MDINETIEILKTHNEKCSGCDKLCDDLCKPAVELAIEALEKQIPTQPRYEGDGYCNGEIVYDMAYCPKCDHDFEYNINDWGSKFCPDCGQALDWSVGEEGEESE